MTAAMLTHTEERGARPKPWTLAELDFVRRLYNAGNTPEAIQAAVPHRTVRAIAEKLWRSRLSRVTIPADTWTLDLRGKLRGRGLLGP